MTSKNFREITINRQNSLSISPTHVNDMVVNHDGKEIFIQLFEIEPPVVLSNDDVDKLKSIEATLKVKLVITPEFTESVIKALTEVLEKFKDIRRKSDDA